MQNPDKMMATAITAFEQWRQNRVNKAVKTPSLLQQQAVALLAHFSSSKINTTLNISGANLKRWSAQVHNKQRQTEFIALPPIDEASPAALNMTLVFNNGCHMRLCGELSPAQLSAITQSVATSSGATS